MSFDSISRSRSPTDAGSERSYSPTSSMGDEGVSGPFIYSSILPEGNTLDTYVNDRSIPAHERVGAVTDRIFALAGESANTKAYAPLLKLVGIDENDTEAHETLKNLFETLEGDPTIEFKMDKESSGAFRIKKTVGEKKVTVAVFKAGRRRSQMELFARALTSHLGLKNAIPGLTVAIEGLNMSAPEDPIKELLYNGTYKTYECDMEATGHKVVGIIEPWLNPPSEKLSPLQLAHIALTIATLGLRDIKEDGVIGDTLIDNEESMPQAPLFPSKADLEKGDIASTIDAPLIKEPAYGTILSKEEVDSLVELVSRWDVTEIMTKLQESKIQFEDKAAELGKSDIDEGGYSITYESEDATRNAPADLSQNGSEMLFNKTQISSCIQRILNIKQFIETRSAQGLSFCPRDLIYAADPYAKMLNETMLRALDESPGSFERSVMQTLESARSATTDSEEPCLGISGRISTSTATYSNPGSPTLLSLVQRALDTGSKPLRSETRVECPLLSPPPIKKKEAAFLAGPVPATVRPQARRPSNEGDKSFRPPARRTARKLFPSSSSSGSVE